MNRRGYLQGRGVEGIRIMRRMRYSALMSLAGLLLFAVGTLGQGVDVRVNQDPPGTVQNTSSIALNPVFAPGNIVVAYNDAPWAPTGLGISFSMNGGATWTDRQILSVWGWEQGPSVSVDGRGNVFAGMYSFDALALGHSGIYVSRSANGGNTWSAPVAVSVQTAPGTQLPFETMPKVIADRYAASPYMNNVYVVWERDLVNGINSNACFSRSTNSGASWSAPAAVINDNQGTDLVLWPDLAVGSDGRVVGGWLDSPFWIQHQGQIWLDRSTDGGQTFGQDVPAVTFWAVPPMLTDLNGLPTYPAMSYPSVEVDPSNPNRIGIVYAADPDDGTAAEARVDVGDQPPGRGDAGLLHPFLHGGSNLSCNRTPPNFEYAVWIDYRRRAPDVFFNRAQIVQGIANWIGPEVMLSTQPRGEHPGSNNASIVSGGSNVYVVWDEWVGVDYVHLIYFNRSLNNGASFLAQAINLDNTQQEAGYNPAISCWGNNVCVAWEVPIDNTHSDIYVNYSTNSGNPGTWRSNAIPVRTGRWATHPHIAQTGTFVYLVWMEAAPGGSTSDIYFSRSTNSGQNWSSPTRLDFNDPPGANISYAPKVCCAGNGRVYVTWGDMRVNGVENPYFAYSSNFGFTWQGDFRLNTGRAAGANRDYYPHIACEGNYVAVVYESDRNQLNGPEDIYMNCSTDGGVTWLTPDVRLDLGDPPAASHSCHPRVSVWDYGFGIHPQVYFYAAWMDDRNAAPFTGWDIYGTFGTFDPTAVPQWQWWPDYRIDVGDQPGANGSWSPQVACDWTGPFYLWRDERNGLGDIYANLVRTGPDEGDIFYVESNDGGATFANPIRVNDDNTTNDQTHPWLDIKPDGRVDVVWYDRRNDPNDQNPEVYFAILLPGALTFTPNVPVTDQPIIAPPGGNWWIGDYIWIDVDVTRAGIVWADTRIDPMNGDIYFDAVVNSTRQLKLGAVAQLAALKPTGDPKLDRKIDEIIGSIERSLDPDLWEDDDHLDPRHGGKVFHEDGLAIGDLMRQLRAVSLPEQVEEVFRGVTLLLLGTDEVLARIAINDAVAAGGNPGEIEKAEAEMANAQMDRDAGQYDKAVGHYKKAWEHAQRAVRGGGHQSAGVSTAPRVFALHQNYPNPFSQMTDIRYQIPVPGRATLRIYDATGRLVKTFFDEEMEPGSYMAGWDRTDASGRRVSSGVYFYRLTATDSSATRKMVVLK